ncbi:MAG: hypothetical protein DCC74_10940 [Proteobacteria bacterium]|nr:MAG: hypothetical protein DCC74_10940 [Pseudomonadota bacterium]
MLPGLRALIAATVLTAALVVFAVGAAALLRATHQVAALPPWQPPPAVMFVSRDADEAPTLSLLRVDEPPGGSASEPDVPVAAPVAAVTVDVLPAIVSEDIVSVDETSIAAAFPAPPEPVVRDATADVLAALPAAAPTETIVPEPSEPETGAAPLPAAEAAADPAPAAEDPVAAPAVAALAAPPSDTESGAKAVSETVEAVEAVPDAVVAHPPLPRVRPSEREIAARKAATAAAAKRARNAALRRQAAVAKSRSQAATPQPDPFASPFAPAFTPAPAATSGR